MRIAPLLLSTSVAAMVAALPAGAEDGDITSVLLSSGGLAEVSRTFEADGPATISLTVPVEQVDDVLKSVIVSDPAGTVTGVKLEGADTVAEAFRTLPFGPEDLASPDRIAAAMRGYEAVVDDGAGRQERGVILGVSAIQQPTDGDAVSVPAVSLQKADGSVIQVILGPSASVSFVDEAVARRITEAGRGLRGGKDGSAKQVVVTTRGEGRRLVTISNVVAAPVWKVAYRVIAGSDGKARIQGWAVLENATGEDWNDVAVTLSSSNPVALSQRLYRMYWRERQEAPIALPGGPVSIRPDDGALSRELADAGDMKMPEPTTEGADQMFRAQTGPATVEVYPVEMSPASPQPSRPSQAVAAVEGDVGIRFTIPERIDLPSGHTLSVPIIDADYDAELVSLWRPDSGSRHPVAALFVTNKSEASVPPGIFTVFEPEGYLGDAQILGIPPGETRYAGFAADPKVSVEATTYGEEEIASVSADRGVVTISRRVERVTTYTVKGAVKAARTVMIDHPRQIGWEILSTDDATIQSTSGSELRLRGSLPPGKDAVLRVTEGTRVGEAVYLLDSDETTLRAWASTSGIDPATAAVFDRLADLRRDLAEAEEAVEQVNVQIQRIEGEQGRVRENLRVVPATADLAKSYLAALEQHEQALTDARVRRDEAEDEVRSLRRAYQDAVANF